MARLAVVALLSLSFQSPAYGLLPGRPRLPRWSTHSAADSASATEDVSSSPPGRASDVSASTVENIVRQPKGTSYFMCSVCKTAYIADTKILGNKGSKVKCGVCEKEWFQTIDRLLKTDENQVLETMPTSAIREVKRIIADRNVPKYPRVPKHSIFVGNLPYNYVEKDILDLFAEYGVTSISLVRDPEGLSKGFAFLEVSSESDAQRLIDEMHWFYTDASRRLTVRSAQQQGDKRGGRDGPKGAGRNTGGKSRE